MPDEPPRLFLSYGVRDASEIAERLHRDLTNCGYEVWQDVNRLRASRPWDEDVPEGLRTSQVVLALLSPHSVRRALDAGNPTATDSVCLDEIAYARGACKIPIVPVQVVSCEVPFLIYRLHQIDFRHWRESEVAYQGGLKQICEGIEAALRGETPERPWRPLLVPWDFAPFLLEKRNYFTGRQWLFRDLDAWRRKETPPALLITGEPGIGKSAIVAALVHENPEGQVLAYHCCRADTPATLDPARFVRSLAGMLAARLEGYAVMLEEPGIMDALERADTDPASAFEAAVLSPLHGVPKTAGDRRYLLIDALDEALMHPKRPTIVEVLAARINRLPSWLGIVATTRSEPGVLSQLRGLPAQALKADDPKNQDDVLAFLQRRLNESGLRTKVEATGKALEDVAPGLLRSSAGNFLFVTTAIDAIDAGQFRLDDIERQPPGHLSSLYEVFFNRLFRDAGMGFQPAGQILELVAAAREPLSREQIAAVTGLDAEKELPLLLGRLAAFVPVREGRYSLFHRSLFEWLTGWDNQQDQAFAGPYHVSLQEGHKRLADWGWAEYEHGFQNASLYCLRHLVAHLHEANRNDQARTVLLDFNYLKTKLTATNPNTLIADYAILPEDNDLRTVQSVLRLSAHILAGKPWELAGQLLGRLPVSLSADIDGLRSRASELKGFPWLRPLCPSFTPLDASLVRTLQGHIDRINAVSVTPNGCHVVSGSRDRAVRVWDLATGETRMTLQGHTDSVRAVAVTPEGRHVVSGSHDNTLRVWDLARGETITKFLGHTSSVSAVAVAPNGRHVVSGSDDRTLRVWDIAARKSIITLWGHTSSVNAVAILPDGRHVISGSDDNTLRVWDMARGKTKTTLMGHTSWVNAVAITPDGHYVVSGSHDNTLRVWDLVTGKTKTTLLGHTSSVNAVAITPDGHYVVSASSDRTLRVWDLATGETKTTLHSDDTVALAVTPDGCQAISGSADCTLHIWDLAMGKTTRTFQSDSVGDSKLLKTVAITPNGRQVVSGSFDNMLRVWDLATRENTTTLHSGDTLALAVTPDGHCVVCASDDHTLRVLDLATGKTKMRLKGHSDKVMVVAVTPGGRYVVSGSADCTLRVWDLATRKTKVTLQGHTEAVNGLAVTPDGRQAVSGSLDCTLRIWDLATGISTATLYGHTGWVSALAITPDGCHVVSGSWDSTLRVWDLARGETKRTLQGHTRWVWALAVTLDGRHVVSASGDKTLRVWNLKNGKEILTFTVDEQVTACVWAQDNRTIVAGDSSGRLHFLQLVGADETKA